MSSGLKHFYKEIAIEDVCIFTGTRTFLYVKNALFMSRESDTILIRNSFVVDKHEDGLRIDAVLAGRFAQFTRSQWQERIRAGDVRVAERLIRPSRRLAAGETVHYEFRRRPEPDVNRNFSVVYEDESLLVVDKPGDLPVHPSGVYHENTLYVLLKERYGADFTVHLVHRLDRETSGLLLLAKNARAARDLQAAFIERRVEKIYLSIVEDPHARFPETLDARGWIFAAGKGVVRKKRSFAYDRPGSAQAAHVQDARTEFFRVQQAKGLTVVRARLHSGRMHQIRATLCSLGFPVVGDRIYGVDEGLYLKMIDDLEDDDDRKRLRLQRTALHAHVLRLHHPDDGRELVFTSELPEDMRGLVG